MDNWIPVPDFPNYEVSDTGNVRRVAHTTTYATKSGVTRNMTFAPLPLKQHYTELSKHPRVSLFRDGKYHNIFVHRLMALAFIGPPPFPRAIVLHENDVAGDNRVKNLRWGTYRDNWTDAQRNGIYVIGLERPCKGGHDKTPDNTYVSPRGVRMCRECQRIRDRARYRRKKKVVTG